MLTVLMILDPRLEYQYFPLIQSENKWRYRKIQELTKVIKDYSMENTNIANSSTSMHGVNQNCDQLKARLKAINQQSQ